MLLKNQQKLGIALSVALVGSLSIWGLSRAFNGASSSQGSAPVAQQTNTQPAPQPYNPPAPQPYNPPSPPVYTPPPAPVEDSAQVLRDLHAKDIRGLQRKYTGVDDAGLPLGNGCLSSGLTNGTGYAGKATSISYNVTDGSGQRGRVCVSRDLARGKNNVTDFVSTSPAPAPVGNNGALDADQKSVLLALKDRDVPQLQKHYAAVSGWNKPFGSSCLSNGLTNGSGYNGNDTSISYNVTDASGRPGRVCVDHYSNGASPRATAFVPTY